MKRRSNLGVIGAMLAVVLASPLVAASLPTHDSQGEALPTLAPMLEKVTPAVVNISTRSRVQVSDNPLLNDPFFRRFFGIPEKRSPRNRVPQSLGSGVIVDAELGYVLTNAHVIDKAHEITVTLRDGRSAEAKLVGADLEADVAVVQIPPIDLVAIQLSNSDRLQVGDFVIAIGNPFGLGQTVTSGIVSALGRSGLGIEGYEDFIQTDASINPGNSGGALVNLRGELVGVNTAIVAPSGGNVGIGFAIPTNMARELMEQLIEFGEIRRGRVGIATQTMTPKLAQAFNVDTNKGAVISGVEPGSVAEKVGMQVGDIIVKLNGRDVDDAISLRNSIGLLRAGTSVEIQAMRDNKRRKFKLEIADSGIINFEGRRVDERFDGAVFGSITQNSIWYEELEGLEILSIDSGSSAWRAGLKKGDVVVSVNGLVVRDQDEMAAALKKTQSSIVLNIRRGPRAMFVLL